MALTYREKIELAWLAMADVPMWGGHFERGEPLSDGPIKDYLNRGLIREVSTPRAGYLISESGLAELEKAAASAVKA